jgi:hypothetical protein
VAPVSSRRRRLRASLKAPQDKMADKQSYYLVISNGWNFLKRGQK